MGLSAARPADRDPSHEILGKGPSGLFPFFHPRRVAVVGATDKEGSVGRAVFRNLLQNPSGVPIVPVNPARPSVADVKAYPSLTRIPDPVDLAIIITPAASVP